VALVTRLLGSPGDRGDRVFGAGPSVGSSRTVELRLSIYGAWLCDLLRSKRISSEFVKQTATNELKVA